MMKEIRRNTIDRLQTSVMETKHSRQRKTYVVSSVRPEDKESKTTTHILSHSDDAKFERQNVVELVTRFIVTVVIIPDKGDRITSDF